MKYGYLAAGSRLLAGLVVAAVMTACGGGGSSSDAPTTPVPTPNGAPVARVADLGLSYVGLPVTLDARTSTDPENDPLSFEWRLVTAPVGSAARLTSPSQAVAGIKPDMAGSYDLQLRVSDAKAAVTELAVRVTAGATPTITTNMPEPVTGPVQLVLSGTVPGSITWSVDQVMLGTTTGTAVANWPSALMANGEHVVLARVTQADGSTLDIQRRIVSSNNESGLTMSFNAQPAPDAFNLNVAVLSPVQWGVKQVKVTLGGKDIGTLDTDTWCAISPAGCNYGRYFVFPIPPTTLPSGTYAGQVIATDILGGVTRWDINVEVAQFPQITNATPADGVFLPRSATLAFTGTISSDPGKTVSANVSIGAQQVFNTTFSSGTDYLLSTQYNLGQLATGTYSAVMSASVPWGGSSLHQWITADIAVLPQGEAPISPLPGIVLTRKGNSDHETLIGADDVSALVMRSKIGSNPTYREVMLDGGASTTIPGTSGLNLNLLGIANRRLYTRDYQLTWCGDTTNCVREWSAAEGWRNLSGSTYPIGDQSSPRFSAGQVAWISNDRLVVYNGGQKKYSTVDLPKTGKTLAIAAFAVKAGVGYAVVQSGEEALYLARSDQVAVETLYSQADWTVGDAVTDGNHVGWRVNYTKTADAQILARAWSAPGAQPSLITTYANKPLGIANGNFVWADIAGIRTTSLSSSRPIIQLTTYGKLAIPTATGVMYESSDALLAWNASTGAFQTLLGVFKTNDTSSPSMNPVATDKALVFQFGGRLYRIAKP